MCDLSMRSFIPSPPLPPSSDVPCASLSDASHADYYFWFHHTNADSITHLNREGLRNSVAAYAVLSYVLADMPERIPTAYKAPPGKVGKR